MAKTKTSGKSVLINGVAYSDPMEAIQAVWDSVLDIEEGTNAWIGEVEDKVFDVVDEIENAPFKKRWWRR